MVRLPIPTQFYRPPRSPTDQTRRTALHPEQPDPSTSAQIVRPRTVRPRRKVGLTVGVGPGSDCPLSHDADAAGQRSDRYNRKGIHHA